MVVKWSACSPSTPTIQVEILLMPTVFTVKFVFEKNEKNKNRQGLSHLKKLIRLLFFNFWKRIRFSWFQHLATLDFLFTSENCAYEPNWNMISNFEQPNCESFGDIGELSWLWCHQCKQCNLTLPKLGKHVLHDYSALCAQLKLFSQSVLIQKDIF